MVKSTARTDVDRFVLAALEAKQLQLNPEADRATLLRRVCFSLTGLPPTVAEIDQFLADKAADAYEKMVDRYLASPAYGERWGKMWLDAAGYADSNGYFSADSDRPLAWRYRDYVVKSFNADKPYDRFVTEQLAGDELAAYTPGGDVTPAMVELLIATHFLRNAPDGTGESDGNPDEVRTDRFTVLEGNVQNLMNCLLGLTVQCARCHDHKFEPISQREYYGLQALLFPVYNPERWTKPNDRVVTIGTKAKLINKNGKAAQDGPAEKIAVFVETDPNPPAHHLLKRGQHGQPGAEVPPGVVAALSTPKNTFAIEPRPAQRVTTGRRTAFAKWVTSPENPLFARVMVNRIWQHHFGTGLVATSNNLGVSGAKPSHPELLDYLAAEFIASRWSVKAMHRLILTSAVFRQSSAPRANLDRIDPDNRLLARFPLLRLDAEAIRDAMLHIAGDLDPRASGPYVPSKVTPEGTVEVAETTAGAHRRSIYLQQRRTQVVTFLQLFDAPSMVTTCGKRSPSTVPLQSLALLNSEFSLARSKAFAVRLFREAEMIPRSGSR